MRRDRRLSILVSEVCADGENGRLMHFITDVKDSAVESFGVLEHRSLCQKKITLTFGFLVGFPRLNFWHIQQSVRVSLTAVSEEP